MANVEQPHLACGHATWSTPARLVEWFHARISIGMLVASRDLRQRIEASVEQQMTDPNGCQLRRMRADVGSIPDRGNLFGNLVPGRTKHLL
jgi:hypothetical protein